MAFLLSVLVCPPACGTELPSSWSHQVRLGLGLGLKHEELGLGLGLELKHEQLKLQNILEDVGDGF